MVMDAPAADATAPPTEGNGEAPQTEAPQETGQTGCVLNVLNARVLSTSTQIMTKLRPFPNHGCILVNQVCS